MKGSGAQRHEQRGHAARIGMFSSDRAIREYCEEIWDAAAVQVGLGGG